MGYASLFIGLAETMHSVEAEKKENEAQQAEAARNQLLAERAAQDALSRGNVDASKARSEGTVTADAQFSAYANSGVDPTVGTAAAVQASTRAQAELDAQTLKNNAAREAWGFRTQGLSYQRQAGLDAQRSKTKQAATILGGAGQAAAAYGRIQSAKEE